MADGASVAYPTAVSPGNPVITEQQYAQQYQAYQAQQANSPGGAYGSQHYAGDPQQQQQQEVLVDPGAAANGHLNQEYVQYAAASRSGAELANGQAVNGVAFDQQQQPGIVQQYINAGQVVSQQGGGGPGQGQNGYKINFDPNPQIIRKHANDAVTYKQEVAVRYLRPPTPPPPGPLIIKEVRNPALPAAPPIVIRQRPPRPATPPPLIIRERPPQPPAQLGPKLITKPVPPPPPPPRRVIIERMPPLPPKPQSIIVERWLPYKQQKRRVIYQKAPPVQPPPPQKNLIIQWEGTQARVVKEFRNLGVIKADPGAYVQQYGPQLRTTQGLPDFVKVLPQPNLGPEYMAGANPDHVDPALLAGAAGQPQFAGGIPQNINGYEVVAGQGLLASASDGSLVGAGQNGFVGQEPQYVQYAAVNGVVDPQQQQQHNGQQFVYQQVAAYSNGSTVEGQPQQFGVDPQQQQGYEQQVQYQSVPQYAAPVSG